ncbi:MULTISPECIES: terminase large subunit domain-containing protein [unclassified Microbacterium]|uniref:terminase large subunit domain-containing protein n=1 Tax=unclassified Microbacterium TaxID=2609290 RepID=UPI00364ADE41
MFTPPRRPLTPKTSAGYAAIHFAEWLHDQLAGTRHAELVPPLNPWQRWFLIHALELTPDGAYRFKTVLLWVARQNGKTFIAALLILFRMVMDGDAQILGVAQKLATAKKTWKHAQKIIDAIPRLKQERGPQSNTNGELWFELSDGQSYWVDAADNGGRGLTFDLVFVDEILKHKTFKAWSALSKTTAARRRSQLIAAANTGDMEAVVQRFLHKQAIDAIEANDDATPIGLFWWSPPPGMPLDTPEAWAYSNPSMNYNLPQENLAAYWISDPRPVFESEVANIFVDSSTGGPFQQGMWNKGLDRLSKRADGADVYICVEVSHDRMMAHIGFAAVRADGDIHVGIMASKPGTDWIVPWLTSPERRFTPAGITFQTAGAPVSSLLGEFEDAELEVTPWGGPDLGRATGLLLDGVNLCKLHHRHQPLLEAAALTAVLKKLGDAYVIDRHAGDYDSSPLSAIAGALWLLKNPPKAPEPKIRTLKRRTRG